VYKTVANGLLLVGDAARHVNPITGGGILEAMKGGKIAGEVIAKAVQEQNFSDRRLMEYEKRWKKELGKVLYAGMKAKQLLLSLDSHDFNEFFHPLSGDIKIKEFTERALLKAMIKKNPKMLFSLARMMF
jgi:digeranylgeranylglycerophospholipid reductase